MSKTTIVWKWNSTSIHELLIVYKYNNNIIAFYLKQLRRVEMNPQDLIQEKHKKMIRKNQQLLVFKCACS